MIRIRLHLLILGALAFAYLGWIAESRWSARRAVPPAGQRSSGKPDIPAAYLTDNSHVKIVHFYTATGEISRGEHAVICYSVLNAKTVEIHPPVEELKPSINRCIAVTPESKTTYTLRATGADGSTATASFDINVVPPPPRIEMMQISAREIKRGQPFQMCYGTRNAHSVRLDPPAVPVTPTKKRCFQWFPAKTTHYTLTASGDRGRTDQLSFTLVVRPR